MPKISKKRPKNIDGKELLDWMMGIAEKDPDTECIIWPRYRSPHGYGIIVYKGKFIRTHRLVYFLLHPEKFDLYGDMYVLHRCDNPPCMNPEHLFLGTHEDNMADMVAKGRAWWIKHTT